MKKVLLPVLLVGQLSRSVPGTIACLKKNPTLTAALPGQARSLAARSTRRSRFRTAGWFWPESCGSEVQQQTFHPSYAGDCLTAMNSWHQNSIISLHDLKLLRLR